jgi:hypothetical protein
MNAHVRMDNHEAGGSMPDLIQPLAKSGRLSHEAMLGYHNLIRDLQAEHGTSGGLALRYCERVQTSLRNFENMTGHTDAHNRCQKIIDALNPKQRDLIAFLTKAKERGASRGNISTWGVDHAKYKSTDLNSAWAVGQIDALGTFLYYQYQRLKVPIAA